MGNSNSTNTDVAGGWNSDAGTCKCKRRSKGDLKFISMRWVIVPMSDGAGAATWNGFASGANAIIPDKLKFNGDFKEFEHDAIEITFFC